MLVVLRTKHISAALFSANFEGGDEVQKHVSAVRTLLNAGAHLATTPSAFAAAFGTLTQAHDALVLLKYRCRRGDGTVPTSVKLKHLGSADDETVKTLVRGHTDEAVHRRCVECVRDPPLVAVENDDRL